MFDTKYTKTNLEVHLKVISVKSLLSLQMHFALPSYHDVITQQ